MAKFCTKCGRPLAEGEVCSCQMQNTSGIQQHAQGAMGNPNQQAQSYPQSGAQTQGYPQSGTQAKGYPQSGVQAQGYPNSGAQAKGCPQSEAQAQGYPNSVAQRQGYSQSGAQAQGYPNSGVQVQGYPNPAGNPQQVQYQQNPYQQGQFQQGMQGSGRQPYNSQQQYEYQQQVQQAQQQYQQMQHAASNLFSKSIGTFISLVKSPVETGKNLIAFADWGVLVILIVFQALMAGFFDLAVMAKISGISAYIKMPYAKSFFAVVLASAALAFILAAMLLAGNLIAKNAVSFQQMLACAAVRSVLLVITTAISIVIFVLFPIGGIFLYYASSLWGTVTMVMIMPRNTPDGKENWLALTQFIVYFLFIIVFFLFALACSKAFVPSASGLGGLESIFDALDYYF